MIRLDRLTGQLKLELQYVLQRRHDDRQGKLTPDVVLRAVRALIDGAWARCSTTTKTTGTSELGCRSTTLAAAAFSATPAGWSPAWLKPAGGKPSTRAMSGGCAAWAARGPHAAIRRDGPAVAARTGETVGAVAAVDRPGLEAGGGRPVVVLTRFAGFLADIGVERIDQIDRSVLERYLADLRGGCLHAQRRGAHIGMLNRFFAAVRQHRWDAALPADAMFFTEDYPKHEERLPGALAEHVMAQLEDPGNLARFADPAHRLITIILMRCGLRITDALRLRSDCVVTDAEGAPYLRYLNHKMKRDALVPIDEQVRELIAEHRNHTAQRWPAGTPVLFPRPTKNIDGTHPIASPTYRMALLRWLSVCDVRDEHGQRVHLTPHQWRHTLGTRLINRDVPQEVVRRILDHDSAQMTGH